jgi:ADP-ribose pyrophosphatase
MKYEYKISNTRDCFKGFFTIVEHEVSHTLFKGGWSSLLYREHVSRGDIVAVLLYDPELDKVVMIEQFRIGATKDEDGAWLLEVVAGYIEDGETSAEDVARRETMEETGCEFSDIEFIGSYYFNAGNSTDKTALYCARVDSLCAGGIHGVGEEGEDIRVHIISYDEAVLKLKQGMIKSATPVICLQWLELNRHKLRSKWC